MDEDHRVMGDIRAQHRAGPDVGASAAATRRSFAYRRPLLAAVLSVAILFSAAACGNKGGATTCLEFLQLAPEDRPAVVQKLLDEEASRDGKTASHDRISEITTAIGMYCNYEGSADTEISEWR